MKVRNDLLWLVAIVVVAALASFIVGRPHRAALQADPAVLADLNATASSDPEACIMWIPFSNVSGETAACVVHMQFPRVPIHIYGQLITVEARPRVLHLIGAMCRRLDQPLALDAWFE